VNRERRKRKRMNENGGMEGALHEAARISGGKNGKGSRE